ncbi:MAG: DUF1858 domain-containing protein [Bacillota bacterium]|uniref:Hybrid cluster protein-associated redox disulfide domain-containing protein n=1 Tax=[Clostridium] aminophilum TaxID=1526 RepID=A0A1I6IZS5_9FIRM|nr:DUF1858 domain-containing protein [[Clostridium] aminophilum]MCR4629889.1 DUF1858 domain-containing protein [Clostridium sp.]MDT3843890.1 DUF1858 domain-containing protein [Bacillota bacterium]SFR72217.1 hybrid cluster protein-associated redox disulfide domain-containing protein [[Clostridium] aminophilum]
MSLSDIFKSKEEKAAAAAKRPIKGTDIVGDILKAHEGAAALLMQCGMGCISCPSSLTESLNDACMVHGMNADEVVDYLNGELELEAENE